jgi:actin-like ATPase involved in cell morphogenesis
VPGFDVKAYEDGVLKPLRPKVPNLPDDLLTRYAVQPGMDPAALRERVDAVLMLWNKHAMRSGPLGLVCKLLVKEHKELEAGGSDPRTPQFWTQWTAAREQRVGGQIDEVVARLTATFGRLGVVTAALLEATASDLSGLGDADLARAAQKAKLRVVEPASLPTAAGMRQSFSTLAKAMAMSGAASVPALLYPGLTGFGLLGGLTAPPGRPLALDRAAAQARNQELEKLPDDPTVRAQKQAVGILANEAGHGTDLGALALYHLLAEVRARRAQGAQPVVLYSLLAARGLVAAEAALVAVTVFAEGGAPARDPMTDVTGPLAAGTRRRSAWMPEGTASSGRVFGLDLGMTYSAIAYLDDTGRPTVCRGRISNSETMPSVVYFETPTNVVVGETAKQYAVLDPRNVVSLIKREMGSGWKANYRGEDYTPEEISALILRQLAADAAAHTGGPVEQVVITVPAYFGGREKKATENAGKIAGLNVVGTLPEPVAAAIHYGLTSGGPAKTVLVYDLGGGTFDTTVLRVSAGEVTVICTDGDTDLGGADWDERLAAHLVSRFTELANPSESPEDDLEFQQEIATKAEDLKKQLSQQQARPLLMRFAGASARIDVTRAEFESMTADLLDRTIEIVQRTLARLQDRWPGATIDEVLLVGGSTRMPAVAARLAAQFGWDPKLHDPDLAVAKGAAIFALAPVTYRVQQQAPGGIPAPAPGWYGNRDRPAQQWQWDGERWTDSTTIPAGVFVSYARADASAVETLARDLGASRMSVWLDSALHGGEPWWERILSEIRSSAVFLYAVSDRSLESEPCQREYEYAEALGIPVLPVQVGPVLNLRTWRIGTHQVVDYRQRDVPQAIRLIQGLADARQQRGPLPDPLPRPPDIPHAYLFRIRVRLQPEELTFREQRAILFDLETELEGSGPDVQADIVSLLKLLRSRSDAALKVVHDVDRILAHVEERPRDNRI